MFKLIHKRVPSNAKNDILSGLTVALALVPEAVAFALLAGLNPLVGLYAAFTIGIVTSILGGRPGMISGATGAIAVIIGTLVALHGVEYLFAAVVLTGIIQIVFGLLRMGKFIRLVPHPVFLGFVNGLAIVIFLSQVKQFKVGGEWITGTPLALMLVIVAITMMIIHFLPKLTRAVPSTLVAIVIGTLAVLFLGLDTRTVGDIAPIGGVFPPFHLPDVPLSIDMLKIVFPYAIVMALVGLIESLLTLNLIDDLTETTGQPNRECIGQGVANTVTGFFGGMGGCAMIGQSLINVSNGARARLSGIVAAVMLLMFIGSMACIFYPDVYFQDIGPVQASFTPADHPHRAQLEALISFCGGLFFTMSMIFSGVKWNPVNGKMAGIGCFVAAAIALFVGTGVFYFAFAGTLLVGGAHIFFFPSNPVPPKAEKAAAP